jgi:hypothetical protein
MTLGEKEVRQRMSIDRGTLIELYKTTLEELHHQETVYVQACVGLAIMIPAFLAAISFLFGEESPVPLAYVNLTKWGTFVLAMLLTTFFSLVIYRINGVFGVCLQVIRNIESKLLKTEMGEKTEVAKTPELNGLLIRMELGKIMFPSWFHKERFWFYIPIGVLAVIGFWYFLFRII